MVLWIFFSSKSFSKYLSNNTKIFSKYAEAMRLHAATTEVTQVLNAPVDSDI